MRFVLLALLCAFVGVGCASNKPGVKKTAAAKKDPVSKSGKVPPALAPALETIGKIVSVNATVRFVVLDFPLNMIPAVGQKMSVYRDGQKIGEVKISGPQNETNIVADITAGSAQASDEVRAD